MRRAVTIALTTLALTLVFATPALAGKPAIETFEFSDAFDIDCGTFTLHEAFTQTVRVTTWFDADGNPTHLHTHVAFDGTITGPGGILTLSDPGHFNEFVEFDGDDVTVHQVGLVYSLRVPGVGLVAHDVGIIGFLADGSVEIKGPHDVWDNGLEALICPLFE